MTTREQERERENANVSAKEKGGYEGLAVQARHPHYHIISERERKEEDGGKEMREGERRREVEEIQFALTKCQQSTKLVV